MSRLKVAILNAAARFSGASARESQIDGAVRAFLADNDIDAGSLSFLTCEEPRRIYHGQTKRDGVTLTYVVAADPDLGVLGGALAPNMTGAQLQLLRYEWSHSLASCIRFYDFLLDRLNIHAQLNNVSPDRSAPR